MSIHYQPERRNVDNHSSQYAHVTLCSEGLTRNAELRYFDEQLSSVLQVRCIGRHSRYYVLVAGDNDRRIGFQPEQFPSPIVVDDVRNGIDVFPFS